MPSRIFTVSEVVRDVKTNLETLYPEVWMEGEISNFLRHSSSGHCYFSLKDPGAQISAVMFCGDAKGLVFKPEDGLQVVEQIVDHAVKLIRGEPTTHQPTNRPTRQPAN